MCHGISSISSSAWCAKGAFVLVQVFPSGKRSSIPHVASLTYSTPQYLHDKVILWLRHGHSQVGKWVAFESTASPAWKTAALGECSNGSSHCRWAPGVWRVDDNLGVYHCVIYEAGQDFQKAARIQDPIGMSVSDTLCIYGFLYMLYMCILIYDIIHMLCSFQCSI